MRSPSAAERTAASVGGLPSRDCVRQSAYDTLDHDQGGSVTSDDLVGLLVLAFIGWLIYRFLATKRFNRDYDDYLRSRGITQEQHIEEIRRQHEDPPSSTSSSSTMKTTGPVGPADQRVNQTIDILKQVIQLGRMAVADPSGPYFTVDRDRIDAEMAAYFLVWLNKDLRTRFEDNPHGEEVIGKIAMLRRRDGT
jgi:hypothetical protein